MSNKVEESLSKYSESDLSVKLCTTMFGVLPFAPEYKFYRSIDEAAGRLGGSPEVVAKAREIALQCGLGDKLPARRRGPYNASRSHPLGLTKKEQEVLHLICEGVNNIAIAEKLSRGKKTIEHHSSSIFRKMNVENRMEAMLRVQNEPWLLKR